MACYHCSELILSASDTIGCSGCQNWAHRKCVYMTSISRKEIEHVNWVCTPCLGKLKFYLSEGETIIKKLDKLQNSIEEKLHDVDSKVESVKEVLTKVEKIAEKPTSSFSPSFSPPSTYAGVAKKHLLVVKSTDSSLKATEKKNEISNALEGIQIVDAKFNQSGNVTLNFETEQMRDEAAAKVDVLDSLSATKTKKLFPKIMICNVSTEESKDDLVQTIIERNNYLQSIDDIADKISLVFEKDAAGATKHYILKCHPEVRGLIYKKGDEIKLEWGVYKVRARYFATICYHCLNYGHIQGRCPVKDNAPCCRKCAGDHSAGSCSSSVKKCINCTRAGKADVDHYANEMCCPVLNAEIAKIRNRTDNGY